MRRPPLPLEARFWAKVDRSAGDDSCWVWKPMAGMNDYGRLKFGGPTNKIVRAHRYSWELHNGPIPEGLFVCHHCDRPHCCNPRHLFLGTQVDNMRDKVAKGRNRPRHTHCKLGHELTASNITVSRKRNGREDWRCKECGRATARLSMRKHRERLRQAKINRMAQTCESLLYSQRT